MSSSSPSISTTRRGWVGRVWARTVISGERPGWDPCQRHRAAHRAPRLLTTPDELDLIIRVNGVWLHGWGRRWYPGGDRGGRRHRVALGVVCGGGVGSASMRRSRSKATTKRRGRAATVVAGADEEAEQ